MITSIAIDIEVLSGQHISKVADDAMELVNKLQLPLNLKFDRGESLVLPDLTTREEIVEEFRELT